MDKSRLKLIFFLVNIFFDKYKLNFLKILLKYQNFLKLLLKNIQILKKFLVIFSLLYLSYLNSLKKLIDFLIVP